jgi:hypothetical protein
MAEKAIVRECVFRVLRTHSLTVAFSALIIRRGREARNIIEVVEFNKFTRGIF